MIADLLDEFSYVILRMSTGHFNLGIRSIGASGYPRRRPHPIDDLNKYYRLIAHKEVTPLVSARLG